MDLVLPARTAERLVAMIPPDKIAEIRDRTDIVAVIGEYVSLRRAGVNWKGLCPFHNEKSPSFNVHPVRQFFHCFGCGKSGDVFTFVRELEGKSFNDALRDLARRAGVDLPEPERNPEASARAARLQSEREQLLALNERVAAFYEHELASPSGEAARRYLGSRGILGALRKEGADEKLITKVFHVGYAPAGWEGLTKFLEQKGVPHELAERAGLVRQRDRLTPEQRPKAGAPPSKATHFDVFVDRVVYALTSPVGEVLGFGGRVLQDVEGQPKYKNSPETLLYKKGENLFGLHAARHQIRRTGRALVVEGNFDVMTLHAVGLGYAVAPQGTAITAEQVKLLSRFAREVVLMLDADPAGRAATLKVIHLFVEAGLPCRIAALKPEIRPDGTQKKVDPDELARKDLPRLRQIIDAAPDAVEYFFAEVAGAAGPAVPDRVHAIHECVPLLRSVQDRLARDLYCEQLAQMLKVPTPRVIQALRDFQARPQPTHRAYHEDAPADVAPIVEDARPEPAKPRELDPIVAKLVSLLGQHPSLVAKVTPALLSQVEDPAVRAFLQAGVRHLALDGRALEEAAPEVKAAVARALLADEFGKDEAEKAFVDLERQITMPKTQVGLIEARKQALDREDMEMVQLLNARILAARRA